MEETQHEKNVFGFLQSTLYFLIILDVYTHCFSFFQPNTPIISRLNEVLYKLPFISNVIISHATVLAMVIVIAAATRSKKDINFSAGKHFLFPLLIGLLTFGGSINILKMHFSSYTLDGVLYGCTYIMGTMFIHVAISNISKKISSGLGKDRWNRDQESFAQNTKLTTAEFDI
jgi:hypothetical protein